MTHKCKAACIRLWYYLHEANKRFFGWLPLALFLFSFVLFAIVFFPAIVHRLADGLAHQPEQFTLVGRVFVSSHDASGTPPAAAKDVRIEIGGFATATDPAGAYRLEFWTPQRDSVTVVLRSGDKTSIRMLRLPSTGDQWTRNWVLED